MIKKILLMALVAVSVSVTAQIGSMKGKGLPVYTMRDNISLPVGTAIANVTFDYKIVTLGQTTYAWTNLNQGSVTGDVWASQLRFWQPGKMENTLTNRVPGTQQTYGQCANPVQNPLTVTFFQNIADNIGFTETDNLTYDATMTNSADAADVTAPVLADPVIAGQTSLQLRLTLSATDDSNDFFYIVEDAANNFSAVSFVNDATLAIVPGINYTLSVKAVDFSGNQSAAKTINVQGQEPVYFTEGVANLNSFKLDSRSLTELVVEGTSTAAPFGDVYVKVSIDGQWVTDGGAAVKEWKVTGINQTAGVQSYILHIPSGEIPGWADGKILTLDLGYITAPINNDWGRYVSPNLLITEGENAGSPILHQVGTGVDIEEVIPTEYECTNNLFNAADWTLGTVYFAPNWVESTNYTAAFADGVLNFTMGDAVPAGDLWQVQVPLQIATAMPVDNTKTFGISMDVTTDSNLPFYVKFMDTDDNVFIEMPLTAASAGTSTVEIFNVSAVGPLTQISKVLFAFGGGNTPANTNFTVGNITLCDQMQEVTAVDNTQANTFAVFPNPVSDVVTIAGLTKATMVSVTDLAGKTVLQTVTDGTLNLQNLKGGIYLLNIENQVIKLIKK